MKTIKASRLELNLIKCAEALFDIANISETEFLTRIQKMNIKKYISFNFYDTENMNPFSLYQKGIIPFTQQSIMLKDGFLHCAYIPQIENTPFEQKTRIFQVPTSTKLLITEDARIFIRNDLEETPGYTKRLTTLLHEIATHNMNFSRFYQEQPL